MKWSIGDRVLPHHIRRSSPICMGLSQIECTLSKSCAVTLQGRNGILLLKVPEKPLYPHLLIQQQHLFLRQSRLQGLLHSAVQRCCQVPRFFPSHHFASLRIGSFLNLIMFMATR